MWRGVWRGVWEDVWECAEGEVCGKGVSEVCTYVGLRWAESCYTPQFT